MTALVSVLTAIAVALLKAPWRLRKDSLREMRAALAEEREFAEAFQEGSPERVGLDRSLLHGVAQYLQDRTWPSRKTVRRTLMVQNLSSVGLVLSIFALPAAVAHPVLESQLPGSTQRDVFGGALFAIEYLFVSVVAMTVVVEWLRAKSERSDKTNASNLTERREQPEQPERTI
jgi:hypothetical protein